MPPDNRSGAELPTQHRPDTTDTAAAKRGLPGAIVRQRRPAGQRPATCRVSLLVPSGRRTRWWYLATCPVCLRPHLGRSRDLPGVTGTRRLPCGHWVAIVVARTYGRTDAGAAA